jgi:hypothetical protein
MSDYPPTIEELIDRLGEVVRLAENLPPEVQSAHKQLADLYEKVRRAQQRHDEIHPE